MQIREELIKEFYNNCPEGLQTDHIIPLVSPEVAGLHVLNNLQHLRTDLNQKKGNRLLECYLEHADGPYCVLNIKDYLSSSKRV